jgi:DNA-binding transcriptional LysR family regulator
MLDLQALQYFYDCYRFKSMSKAAIANHVSRPTVSHAIKRLEDHLGVPLVYHRRRVFELTDEGYHLGDSAKNLFESVEHLESSLTGNRINDLSGTLRLGCSHVLATFRCDEILMAICRSHPKLRMRFNLTNSEDILDSLADRQLDAALIISEKLGEDMQSITLYQGMYVLVKPDVLPMQETRYATTEWRPEIDVTKIRYRKHFKHDFPAFTEIPSWDIIWNWIQKGHCGGLIPDLFLHRKPYRQPKISVLLRDLHPYSIRLVFNESKVNNHIIQTLAREFKSAFQGMQKAF